MSHRVGRARALSSAGLGLLLLCGILPLVPGSSLAGEGDVFSAILDTSLTHDDNVFRVPDDYNMVAFTGGKARSDTIRGTGLTLRFDKPIGRQRLLLEFKPQKVRFDRFSFLDHNRNDYTARLDWQLGNRLSGDLHRVRRQMLTDFGDFRSPTRNIRNQIDDGLSARWWLHAEWYLTGRLARIESKNDTAVRRWDDSTTDIAEAGLLYRTGSGNDIGLQLSDTEGDYPLQPRLLYRQRLVQVNASWRLTGKSTLRGYLGRVEREQPRDPRRNYRGANGRLSWDWAISGKTALNVSARREVSAYQDFFSDYAVTDSLSVAPIWKPTEKLGLSLNLEHSKRNYVGELGALFGMQRRDTLRSAGVTAVWDPWRFLRLSAGLRRELRDSTNNFYDYKSSSAFLGAQLSF